MSVSTSRRDSATIAASARVARAGLPRTPTGRGPSPPRARNPRSQGCLVECAAARKPRPAAGARRCLPRVTSTLTKHPSCSNHERVHRPPMQLRAPATRATDKHARARNVGVNNDIVGAGLPVCVCVCVCVVCLRCLCVRVSVVPRLNQSSALLLESESDPRNAAPAPGAGGRPIQRRA